MATVFAVGMLVVLTAVGGAAAVPAGAPDSVTDPGDRGGSQDPERGNVSSRLHNATGTVQVVVRLDAVPVDRVAEGNGTAVLRDHARTTQRPLLRFATERDGVTVLREFWLANAVLLRVDTDEVPLEAITRVPYVERLHGNDRVQVVDPLRSSTSTRPSDPQPGVVSSGGYTTTYGLDQINATEVWNAYGTRGEGVKVAVLDTGVDAGHPDIDLYTDDASDPTYPGGWAEFNATGGRIAGSTPHDTLEHGTHTSGTVAGGNASGQWVGVAPEAELMHGLVAPSGYTTITQTVAGMEWAVENDADVLSISLGLADDSDWREPVVNAEAAGTVVVVAAGNDGNGTSDSPGNVYESLTVGASNETGGIVWFSGGEVVDADTFAPHPYPEEWPTSYVVPDVAAPGYLVRSTLPGGGYGIKNGTSMATPHVAGTVALMQAATDEDLPVSKLKLTLYATAWKPPGEPAGNDTRYGAGLVDAKAAVDRVALDGGVNGTVLNASGSPVAGATVETDIGSTSYNFTVATDSSGRYSLPARSGTTAVTADGLGYAATTRTVTIPTGGYAVRNFTLAPALEGVQTDYAPDVLDSHDAVTLTYRVGSADDLSVSLDGDFDRRQAAVLVDGHETQFGTPVDVPTRSETVSVTVDPQPFSEGNFSVNVTVTGEGDSLDLVSDEVRVFPRMTHVAVLDTRFRPNCFGQCTFGEEVAGMLQGRLPANHTVTNETPATIRGAIDTYDVVVVSRFNESKDQFVRWFVDRTDSKEVGVVYLEQEGEASNAISQLAADTGLVDSTGEKPEVFEDSPGDERMYVRKTHPIFYYVGSAGWTFGVHGAYADRAWFTGYHGQTIAEVGNDTAVDGDAVAVDPANNTVLAATLGYNYDTAGEFTEDAKQTLENAVRWADPAPRSACRDITAPGSYTLANDTFNAAGGRVGGDVCIHVNASDVVLDGRGHAVDGVHEGLKTGILVGGSGTVSNVTVRNVTVSDWYEGVKVVDGSEVTVTDVRAESNELLGVRIDDSRNATVSAVRAIANGDDGVTVFASVGTTVTDSAVRDNEIGVNLFGSNRTTVADVASRNNSYTGVGSLATVDATLRNVSATENAYGALVVSSANTTIRDSTLDRNDRVAPVDVNLSKTAGALVLDARNTTIKNTTTDSNDGIGVLVFNATASRLDGVRAVGNANWSVYLANGSTGTVAQNLRLASGTTVSMRGYDVGLTGVAAPPALPEDRGDVGVFVNATNTSAGAWLHLNASYDAGDATGVNESTLEYWRHAGSWGTVGAATTVDTTNDRVGANLTAIDGPAVYAPLAERRATGTLVGQVTDSSGTAVEGATVAVSNASSGTVVATETTAPNGSFSVSSLGVGTYTVTANAAGYHSATTTVAVEDGDTTTVSLALTEALLEKRWSHDADGRIQYAEPAVGPGRIFVGGLDDTLTALYRSNGSVAWEYDRAGSLVDSSPALSDGRVFVGSGSGTVYALDGDAGTVEWTTTTDSAVVSSPTVAGPTVFVGSNDGTVLALATADGSVRWTTELHGPVYSTVSVAGGRAFVSTNDGRVLALNTSTGAVVWQYDTGTELGHSSPVVATGTVYVAGDSVHALDASDGAVEWQTPVGGTAGSTPAVAEGTLYVGGANGSVSALSTATGGVVWTHSTGSPVASSPAVSGDRVVVGTDGGVVTMLNATSGAPVDTRSMAGRIRSPIVVANDVAYVGDRTGTVVALENVTAAP